MSKPAFVYKVDITLWYYLPVNRFAEPYQKVTFIVTTNVVIKATTWSPFVSKEEK